MILEHSQALIRNLLIRRALASMERVRRSSHPLARAIAIAFEEAVKGQLTDEEALWVHRIEALRCQLLDDATSVEVVDYGAGDPQTDRLEGEMLAGVRLTRQVSEVCQFSKPPFWALLLFKLVRSLRSDSILELGSCLGISAAYQAAAQSLNGCGRMATVEGSPVLAEMVKRHCVKLELPQCRVYCGRFQDRLEEIFRDYAPLDFVFIDGHHDEYATIGYFHQILPHLTKSAVIVFDDITWSAGMRRAWNQIATNDRVHLAINLRAVGVCAIDDPTPKNVIINAPLMLM